MKLRIILLLTQVKVGAAFNIHYLSKGNKLKKSTNLSIFLDNSDLIDYSKDLKDISKQDISDLKSNIMAQYINNFWPIVKLS